MRHSAYIDCPECKGKAFVYVDNSVDEVLDCLAVDLDKGVKKVPCPSCETGLVLKCTCGWNRDPFCPAHATSAYLHKRVFELEQQLEGRTVLLKTVMAKLMSEVLTCTCFETINTRCFRHRFRDYLRDQFHFVRERIVQAKNQVTVTRMRKKAGRPASQCAFEKEK